MAFPTTTLLDDFNRANASPPSASWSGPIFGANHLAVSSNTCVGNGGASGSDYWNTTVGPDTEVWAKFATLGGYLYVRMKDPGSGTSDGYVVTPSTVSGNCTVCRIDNGALTQLGSGLGSAAANGDVIGLEIISDTLQAYKNGSAWSTTRSDSTYSVAGYIGIYASSASTVIDDFGGGTVDGGGGGDPPTGKISADNTFSSRYKDG